jgi:hypothetical protein
MLVTDDDRLADLARSMRVHGWAREMANCADLEAASPWIDPRFLFVNVGYNLRPTELQAAFGLMQLPQLNRFNEIRRSNAKYLLDRLGGLTERLTFMTEQQGGRSTWFGFAIMLEDAQVKRRLSSHLEERGIETRPIVAGNLAIQPGFRDRPHRTVGTLRGATAVGERVCSSAIIRLSRPSTSITSLARSRSSSLWRSEQGSRRPGKLVRAVTHRALITGVSGFAGRHLARQLLTEGWQVAGTSWSRRADIPGAQEHPIESCYKPGLTWLIA